jgi:tetratricopeptide (TPR) repeat protein
MENKIYPQMLNTTLTAQKIDRLRNKDKKYLQNNMFNKSLKCKFNILNLLKDQEGHYFKIIYGETLKSIGQILYRERKKYKEAISYLKRSLNAFSSCKTFSEQPNILFELYYDLYKCCYEVSDREGLIKYGELSANNCNISEDLKCKIYTNIGRFNLLEYLEYSQYKYLFRAIFYCTEAIKLYENLKNVNSIEYIQCLFDCGEIYYFLNDYDFSIICFEEVILLNNKISVSKDLLYSVYYRMSEIYKEKGYEETSLYYLSESKKCV